jgi:hypothetical protein
MTQFICRGIITGSNGVIHPDLASKKAIYVRDQKWEAGLKRIGERYNLEISLSPDIYV